MIGARAGGASLGRAVLEGFSEEVAFHSAWTWRGEAAVPGRGNREGGKHTIETFGEQQVILARAQLQVPFM